MHDRIAVIGLVEGVAAAAGADLELLGGDALDVVPVHGDVLVAVLPLLGVVAAQTVGQLKQES